ncbi:hypothetical protein IAT40_002405 [Kwoniella sp. CBS 6097]
MPTPTENQQRLFSAIISHAGFGANLEPHIRLYEVDELPEEDEKGWRKVDGWKLSCEGIVTEDMCNPNGVLHGAASAWLLDTCTSAALVGIHTPTFWGLPDLAGVTLTMEIQCLKAAKLGTKFKVDVEIVKCSNKLANLRCEIKDFHTGKIFATGTHLKMWKGLAIDESPIDTKAALAKL